MTHGSRSGYDAGCRCAPCVEAKRAYWRRDYNLRLRQYRLRKVPAERVRRHILALKQAGLGAPAIAAASGVSPNRIHAIRRGQTRCIWRRTAEKLLSVTPDAIADGARVDSAPTVQLLRLAREEGYSVTDIARVMHRAPVTVQNLFYRRRVTARTALLVRRAVRRLGVL